jgi:geranylgeranyl reductase family protein
VSYEVIVVGAGPAGCAAAYWLARAGRSVLLVDRMSFPRDKPCGDGLTLVAAQCLERMGLTDVLDGAWAARVRYHGYNATTIAPLNKPVQLVPRRVLDDTLLRHARSAGSLVRTGCRVLDIVDGAQGCEVTVESDGAAETLHAGHVVLAAGATGRRIIDHAGEHSAAHGFAIRQYFRHDRADHDALDVMMPVVASHDGGILPAYGWVFPAGPGLLNVGLGAYGDTCSPSIVRTRYIEFIGELRDGLLATAVPDGRSAGGQLRCDYDPTRSSTGRVLLVGDAAGLASPFTGEGIGFALESGELAAEAIQSGFGDPDAVRAVYDRALRLRYVPYFETGRQAALRYQLTCRVLQSTVADDSPLFRFVRDVTTSPGGPAASAEDPETNIAGALGPLRPRLELAVVAINEVLCATIRKEWPFLTRWLIRGAPQDTMVLRPGLLCALASLCTDHADPLALHGAALEFGVLGAIAGLSVDDEPRPCPDGIDWANKVAVMASDFLLTQALKTATAAGGDTPTLFSEWLHRLSTDRVAALEAGIDAELDRFVATLYEGAVALPLRIGAADAAGRVDEFGRRLAVALRLVDDVRLHQGRRSRIGVTLDFARRKRLVGSANDPAALISCASRALDAAHAALAPSWSDQHREIFTALLAVIRGELTSATGREQ